MGVNGFGGGVQMVVGVSKQVWVSFVCVKLGIRTEMSGPKLCEALASTSRLRHSLDGCLEFRKSGRSRRVWN